jgi:DNA-binding GntR family transcriptional regulator
MERDAKAPRRRGRQPARGQTRSNFLEERLAEEIINGRLLPGTRLEEQAIADRFKTSRTPVREALRRLAATGLIEMRPRRGVVVSTVTRDRLAQMFEAMAELEGVCARLAADRMTAAQRDELAALQDAGAAITRTGNPDAYEVHNRAFHAAIYRGSGNAVLEETTQAVRARLAPFRSAQFHIPGRVAKSNAEHADVVDAILGGDGERAYAAMRYHMMTVSDASAAFAVRR